MSKNTAEPSLTLQQMHDSALQLMSSQGVTPEQLDPAVVVLATNNLKAVEAASTNVVLLGFISDWEPSHPDNTFEVSKDTVQVSKELDAFRLDVDNTAYKLANPSRRRSFSGAALAGLAFSGWMLHGIGDSKYDMRTIPGTNVTTAVIGDQLFKGNTLTYDRSIMPGDMGKDIPVLGTVLQNIPGVPDYGGLAYKTTKLVEKETSITDVVKKDHYGSGNTLNPVAADLELTGKEYQLGREAARKLLQGIDGKHFQVKSLSVEGLVSDDFGGKLGVVNPEQVNLAYDRAEVGVKAFLDEAKAEGINVNVKPATTGYEVVLDEGQIAEIDAVAKKLNLSQKELLSAYNSDVKLDKATKQLLDKYIGKNRGTVISLSGTQSVVSQVPITTFELAPDEQSSLNDLSGEPLAAFTMAPFLMYGGVYSLTRKFRRQVRNRAQKIAKEAGLKLDK